MAVTDLPCWHPVRQVPPLPAGEIHVWRFALDPAALTAVGSVAVWLSSDEKERAARYLAPAARARFRLTRGLLRWVLAGYLGWSPDHLVFQYGTQGKPALAGAGLQFNLSHAGDWALLAVTLDQPLGIDLEQLDPRRHPMAIARRVFSPQICRELAALEQERQHEQFFHHWTALEARVKARGDGVFRQLQEGRGEDWPLRHWCPAPGYLAALAAPKLPADASAWVWLEPLLPTRTAA